MPGKPKSDTCKANTKEGRSVAVMVHPDLISPLLEEFVMFVY